MSIDINDILAEGVKLLPLFLIPVLLKKSFNAIPALGNAVNKLSSRAGRGISKQAKKGYERSDLFAQRKSSKENKEAFLDQKRNERLQNKYNKSQMRRDKAISKLSPAAQEKMRASNYGTSKSLAAAQAAQAVRKREEEMVSAQSASLDRFLGESIDGGDAIKNAAMQGVINTARGTIKLTREQKIAAGQKYAAAASPEGLIEFAEHVARSDDAGERRILKDSIGNAAKDKNMVGFGGGTLAAIESGSKSLNINEKIVDAINEGKVTGEALLSMSPEVMKTVTAAASSNPQSNKIVQAESAKILDASVTEGRYGNRSIPSEGTEAYRALKDMSPGWTPLLAEIKGEKTTTESIAAAPVKDLVSAFKSVERPQIDKVLVQIASIPDEKTKNEMLVNLETELKTTLDAYHLQSSPDGRPMYENNAEYEKLKSLMRNYTPPQGPTPPVV